jgi:hypothetical protein
MKEIISLIYIGMCITLVILYIAVAIIGLIEIFKEDIK